jgi:hypothetical protein
VALSSERPRALLIICIVLARASTLAYAQTIPPELHKLYDEADLDPVNNPCLTGHIPATAAEHAERHKCMLQEYVRHGEPEGQSEVPETHMRAYIGQAQMMESAASYAEMRYRQISAAGATP